MNKNFIYEYLDLWKIWIHHSAKKNERANFQPMQFMERKKCNFSIPNGLGEKEESIKKGLLDVGAETYSEN